MKRELLIRLLAGLIILTGISLSYFVDYRWLILPTFVSISLIQSSFTNFCPLEVILEAVGVLKKEKKD